MTQIHPFPGLRFNADRWPDLKSIISPPYDKIPPELRRDLWAKDEHNVVKLILPPPSDSDLDVTTHSTDSESTNWYAEAAQRLQDWRNEGVIVQDPDRLYVYSQSYDAEGVRHTRTGLFAALELEDNAGPKAHEHTFEGPKADRLRLTRATRCNMSPIFLLSDGDASLWKGIFDSADETILDFDDDEGQHHTLKALSGEAARQAQASVSDCQLVIADGHHRYETALNYRREMMEQTGGDPKTEAWGRVLAYIVPLADPGLIVLPTHRVLKGKAEAAAALPEKLKAYGSVEPVEFTSGEAARDRLSADESLSQIVLYTPGQSWLFTMKGDADSPALKQAPEAIRSLNVSILHRLIFEDLLGLAPESVIDHVKYIRGEDEAMALAAQAEYDMAFLTAGIPPARVFDVSMQGVRMPQKSTDFFPKVPTGLLIRPAHS